jgi:hypothetical protein
MSSNLLDEPPMLILPSLAIALGLDDALFLQQCWFWTQHYRRARDLRHYHAGTWWIWNTVDSWHLQFPWWSTRTIARIISRLRKRGLIQVARYNLYRYDQTRWYAVDEARAQQLVPPEIPPCQNGSMDHANLAQSTLPEWQDGSCQNGSMLPETTTETTQRWSECLGELQMQMTQTCFDTWLAGTALVLEGNIATIHCRGPYASEWLRHRLNTPVARTVRAMFKNPQLQIVYVP